MEKIDSEKGAEPGRYYVSSSNNLNFYAYQMEA